MKMTRGEGRSEEGEEKERQVFKGRAGGGGGDGFRWGVLGGGGNEKGQEEVIGRGTGRR